MKIGATTIPMAGWIVDPLQTDHLRRERLEVIRKLVEDHSLSVVELSLDLAVLYPHIFDNTFYEQVAELQAGLGFHCTVHLPFLWIDPASLNERIRQSSQDSLLKAIELTRSIQIESYVVHLWGNTTIQIATLLESPEEISAFLDYILAQADRSLSALCKVIKPSRLCVETLEMPPFNFILPLISKLNTSICLDIGHAGRHNRDLMDFLQNQFQRITEVHLHDFHHSHTGDQHRYHDHLPLGTGEFDYHSFLRALKEMDYEGVIILELNNHKDLMISLDAIGEYLHE